MFIKECFLTLDICESKAIKLDDFNLGEDGRAGYVSSEIWACVFPLCCRSYLQKRSNPVKRTHFLIWLWGHFSCLDNSSRSNVTRGSRWNNGLFCDGPRAPVRAAWWILRGRGRKSQLEFTLHPAVQQLTNSKDQFHRFIKKKKEEFTSDCAQH